MSERSSSDEAEDERTPEKSSRKRLKFNQERNLESNSQQEEFIAEAEDVDEFVEEKESPKNTNQSNAKIKGGRRKRKADDLLLSDLGEDETDTYDSDGIISFNKSKGNKGRKPPPNPPLGRNRAKKGRQVDERKVSLSDEESRRFADWCQKYEKFKMWEAQNKDAQENLPGCSADETITTRQPDCTSPYDEDQDFRDQGKISGNTVNEKATQSPSDSTIYSRLCKSISDLGVSQGKGPEPHIAKNFDKTKTGFAIDRMLNEMRSNSIGEPPTISGRESSSRDVVSKRNIDLRVRLDRTRSYHSPGRGGCSRSRDRGRGEKRRMNSPRHERRDHHRDTVSDDSDDDGRQRRSRRAEIESKERQDKIIVDMELRRAELLKPGEVNLNHLWYDAQHKTLGSHIDKALKLKCMRGEFVDLERLLPRRKRSVRERKQLTLVSEEGGRPRFVEEDDGTVINSYRKWEAAFEVYASLYVRVNPGRADELYNYKHLIRDRANDYIWDNVYDYDIDFRDHMDEHPDRMWSEMLVKEWTRHMKVHLNPRNNNSNGASYPRAEWRDSNDMAVCRRYNAGQCTYGKSCKFAHKCKLCGKRGHGASICRRRSDKSDSKMSVTSQSSVSEHSRKEHKKKRDD